MASFCLEYLFVWLLKQVFEKISYICMILSSDTPRLSFQTLAISLRLGFVYFSKVTNWRTSKSSHFPPSPMFCDLLMKQKNMKKRGLKAIHTCGWFWVITHYHSNTLNVHFTTWDLIACGLLDYLVIYCSSRCALFMFPIFFSTSITRPRTICRMVSLLNAMSGT